ncbi:prenyltransferase/squalene oxidase repeat-containing protein [Bdellovibrio sp.]|uniref:prenyltransferase/squalene oxidase repeat-containing protein n=1 Tax=Bdellovibrio sp. TaxID=28201 RepID=UPI0039E4A260
MDWGPRLMRIFLGGLLGIPSWGWAAANYDREIRSGLNFIEHYQTHGDEGYEPGQWRARVTSYVPSAIGVGKMGVPFEDPSAFVTSSVANVLAEIYSINSRYQEVLPLLEKARGGLKPYRWGSLFHFYPPKTFKGVKVRGPRFMYLARAWQGFANIPPDADTTSVTYTLLHYLQSFDQGLSPQEQRSTLPPQVLEAFSTARDLARVPHAYNAVQGHIKTGAFLTWLWDEKDPNMPRNIFALPHRGTRIPFNFNDVDCVVNGNVLKLLTYAGKTTGPGYRASCNHLNRVVQNKQFYFCGMYYPSYYALPYVMAENLHAGTRCLEPSRERLVNFVISRQNKDGSWRNSFLARPDYVQSTVWALNALMILGDPHNDLHRNRVRRGLHFLLSQAQHDPEGRLFWSGQVFFAATFVARYPVVWRSTSYTTALALKALALADQKWRVP